MLICNNFSTKYLDCSNICFLYVCIYYVLSLLLPGSVSCCSHFLKGFWNFFAVLFLHLFSFFGKERNYSHLRYKYSKLVRTRNQSIANINLKRYLSANCKHQKLCQWKQYVVSTPTEVSPDEVNQGIDFFESDFGR